MLDLTPFHVAWIAFAGLLHATIGYLAVAYLTRYSPWWGFLGGILPDIDGVFLLLGTEFPLVHRGLTHTPIFLAGLLIGLWILGAWQGILHGVGIGYTLHLIFDTLSGWGVMWFFPLETVPVHIDWGVNRFVNLVFLVLIAWSLAALMLPKDRTRAIR